MGGLTMPLQPSFKQFKTLQGGADLCSPHWQTHGLLRRTVSEATSIGLANAHLTGLQKDPCSSDKGWLHRPPFLTTRQSPSSSSTSSARSDNKCKETPNLFQWGAVQTLETGVPATFKGKEFTVACEMQM